MTKKRFSEFENGNFVPKKRHSEILVCEKCFRPLQTRRQVSATVDKSTGWTAAWRRHL